MFISNRWSTEQSNSRTFKVHEFGSWFLAVSSASVTLRELQSTAVVRFLIEVLWQRRLRSHQKHPWVISKWKYMESSFSGFSFSAACITDAGCLVGCRERRQLWSASDVLLCQHLFCGRCWRTSGSASTDTHWISLKADIALLTRKYDIALLLPGSKSWRSGLWQGKPSGKDEGMKGVDSPDWKVLLSTLQQGGRWVM